MVSSRNPRIGRRPVERLDFDHISIAISGKQEMGPFRPIPEIPAEACVNGRTSEYKRYGY